MAVRDIRLEGDPVLLQIAQPVTQFDADLAMLVRDMFDTMYAAPGRGLAAPQIGVGQRIFVVDTKWKEADPEPLIFVNPRITARADDELHGAEACLSIPGKSFQVPRPAWVEMIWQDLDTVSHSGRFDGVEAVCLCHELDHLDGILITQTGALI